MSTLITSLMLLIPVFLLLIKRRRSTKKLPPGSLGIPVIGQSLSFLRAMRANTAEQWLEERIKRYGPISKLTLFGKPTVFLHGPAANKFIFTSDNSIIANQQVKSIKMILGERNLLELNSDDHRRVRSALMLFLKPDSLKHYVGNLEEEIRWHLEMHWQGKQEVTVLPLMKTLTFNIISSLLFGIQRGSRRDKLVDLFRQMMDGMWSVPLNFPFTRYSRSLKASKMVQNIVSQLIHEKRVELEQKGASPQQDLITCLLSIRNDKNEEMITEKEIVHNVVLVMTAGHDTSSILLTFMLRFLSTEPAIYEAVLQEQEEIARTKAAGEFLTWEDLAKMKYTWRVALETLRMVSPVFGSFRKTLKDLEYGGYLIPKGWQIFWASPMTHMDNDIYPEPSKFDPNRFENQASVPSYSFVAFGGGPRMCPGNEFARIETLITIHYLVTRFTWKLCADTSFCRDPMPVPAQGLPLQIKQKKPL
ncbi:Cytochrome P450, E-class, group I [Parasponia andersonii]|uniref:Cytochrome P450, E-class, group I n=1 Tax=Parasponia andersonii TaxID=3476 RepID=A0A2P5BS05_PARAD|nr:Cytochrome P450, E-class, group I [Parasponia andersonii]